jgi:hypothetical protein
LISTVQIMKNEFRLKLSTKSHNQIANKVAFASKPRLRLKSA